ncbi:ABC transporter substrate-binding protein [Calderihabitans maritimus]|uniref:ABC-type nitrate/sulfonate/bicarbonate transport systems, periplasmic components n=1 Tax=Calderihabitans maritimus TaxID=1246530 RepID=A0A1Z5HQ92_9FIRM|nr:MetQ/NlpA family ABC transporter substrate-binding protein [Calderihabitans maritimus]GAW91491.1 ABC-type nitrate/sulfonate/bicarbonate transport systems, periplasmic components [Calderihabitans maritimus]
MKRILWRALPLLLLLVLVTAGCSNSEQPKSEASFSNQPLKIGVLPIEDSFPLWVAEENNMFQQAGLTVEIIPFNSARDRDTAMQAGQIDGEVADILAAALLKKAGTEVRIVSLTLGATPEEGRFVLLASPNSGINSVAQLRGQEVALSENTIIEYVADQMLTIAGLKPEEVRKVAIPRIPERLQLLLSDQVKAAVLPDPLATLAESKGAKVVIDDTRLTENISQVVMLFNQKALTEKREAIKRLIEVWGKAAAEVSRNPEKYRKLFNEKARVPEALQDTYVIPSFSQPQVPKEEEVKRLVNWAVEKKLLDKPYSYSELVDETFIGN